MRLSPRFLLLPLLVAGLAATGCSNAREDQDAYEERQTIRSEGQSKANQAADKGVSDLNQATAPGK